MNLPERFDITYVDEDGNRDKRPVMLHRALFGSLERFIGILIEHFEGNFPVWLAPQQAVVVNITDKQSDYAEDVVSTLKAQGFRVASDLRNEKVGFKIREAELSKMPYVLVVGEKEREAGTVAVRGRHGADLGVMSIADFGAHLQTEIANKSVVNKTA